MRKPEQRLYDTMKANCANGVRLERIENGVGTGVPDVHGARRDTPVARTCWIELKVVKRPKRAHTPLFKRKTMRPDQVAWHLSYASINGRSVILARDDKYQLYLFPGAMAARLHELPLAGCAPFAVASWDEFYKRAFD